VAESGASIHSLQRDPDGDQAGSIRAEGSDGKAKLDAIALVDDPDVLREIVERTVETLLEEEMLAQRPEGTRRRMLRVHWRAMGVWEWV
jgi:hypothetical protein